MKIVFKFIIIPFFVVNSFPQEDWYFQNPIPTSDELNSVQFISPDTGWAIGLNGTIIHSTDGGTNWKLQKTMFNKVEDICFVDKNCGWVIGSNYSDDDYIWDFPTSEAFLIKTINGGEEWAIQSKLENNPCTIFFSDIKTGWIAFSNGIINKTTDGGEDWFVQDSLGWPIMDLYFINKQTGWAVGGWSEAYDVTIFKTENGGEDWIPQSGGVKGVLGSVFFLNKDIGWTVGTGIILKTEDGGETWISLSPGENSLCQFTSVYFSDVNNGYISGWGKFITTKNGGENWTVENTYLLSVFFINPQIGWRVGTKGIIQKTTNAGDTWINQSKSFTNSELTHVDFIDKSNGWITSPENIYHSNNGGQFWEVQKTISIPHLINNLFAIDSLNCWAVGYNIWDSTAFIMNTHDAGQNWEQQNFNSHALLNDIFFSDVKDGWIAGDSGIILFTDNGGENWVKQKSGIISNITMIDFINNKLGWVACYDGKILHTSNGGSNWSVLANTIPRSRSIDFVDSLNGWLVGGDYWPDIKIQKNRKNILRTNGYIYHTSDGGKNWIQQLESSTIYSSVKFINENIGWAAGGSALYKQPGNLLFTMDGGKNWEKRSIPIISINSLDFIDKRTGWLVGMDGSIMHTSNDGITLIKEPMQAHSINPESFILNQNYPNPFNPKTTIKYSIPYVETRHASSLQSVTLKVYDILGREIAVLVNEEQKPGNYEVKWDASNQPSGVYFYRITVGNYVKSKKMVLLR